VLGERIAGAVEPDRGGERDRAAADPDREEVGVGGAALPEAIGPGDHRPQLGRVGMELLGGGELCRGQLVGPHRGSGEVGEIAGAFAAPGPAGGAAFPETQRQPGHDRRPGRGDDQGDEPRGAGTGHREQEPDRPAAADQRDQVREPAGEPGGGPADRGRGGERQLPGR
jgi:hypothetical protein